LNKKTKCIIVIAGPTAVGKTALSIYLAHKYKTVILSADSRQFYRELEIGTAKPTQKELEETKHYFINNLSIHDNYNVGHFEKDALNLLEELFLLHDVVIVTGGSGLYVKALCNGLDAMPSVPDSIRDRWNAVFKERGLGYLQEELKRVDIDYFQEVDINNPMRLIRGLEVFEASGKNMSYWRSTNNEIERPFKVIKVGLNRDREELYSRIDDRMTQMISEGLFDEAKKFYPLRSLNALQTVGYSEIFGYLDGEYDKVEAIRLLARNSRRYAKRQITWFNKDETFQWFHPNSEHGIQEYIEQQIGS
jgi:tRNA dimethylallyltransferase